MDRDLFNNVKTTSGTVPVVILATAAGTGVDSQGFHSLVALAEFGVPGITTSGANYIEAELQESADNATFVACADADVQGFVGVANGATNTGCFALVNLNTKASQAYKAGYLGAARYLRVNFRFTGTHGTGTPLSSVFVEGGADYRPVSGNAT